MKPILSSKFRLLGSGLLLATAIPGMGAQMADNFGQRPQVADASLVLTADTTSATMEPDERHPSDGRPPTRTVWAQWTAPANGIVDIDTLGTTFSLPVIGVYIGPDLANLSTVAQGLGPLGPNPAKVRFPVAAGQAYQIVLGTTSNRSDGDGPGIVNLRLTAQESPGSVVGENVFAKRRVLQGFQAIGVANNKLAGRDPGEPTTIARADKSVWWEWTAPATGKVTIDTLDSDFDTTLTVFAGDTSTLDLFPKLDAVAAGKDLPSSERSRLSFQTEAGRTYQINVDGDSYRVDGEGNIVLRLDLQANNSPAAIPGADLFARRGILTGMNAAGVACNHHFSIEAFEPLAKGDRDHTAWWQWTAPADGIMILDTIQSHPVAYDTFYTSLRVFSGTQLESLQEIAAGVTIPETGWSRLVFTAKGGQVYQIVVDGGTYRPTGDGNIVLNLQPAPVPEISVQQPARLELAAGKSKRSFGRVRVKSKSASMTFVIRNTGTATLTDLALFKSGRHAGDFIADRLPFTTLAPGASMAFKVRFVPRAKGTRNAVIRILSNDSDERNFDIRVTGTGTIR